MDIFKIRFDNGLSRDVFFKICPVLLVHVDSKICPSELAIEAATGNTGKAIGKLPYMIDNIVHLEKQKRNRILDKHIFVIFYKHIKRYISILTVFIYRFKNKPYLLV